MAQQKRTWTAGIGQLLSRMGLQNRHAPIIAAMVAVAIIISGIAIAHVVVQPADQAAGITLEHKEDSSSAELQDGKEQVGDTDNSSSGQTVFVDVNGAVRKPSVYELKAGSRVIDAIDAAGGLTDDAESSSVNLARAVVDGEQIHIPSDKELAEASSQGTQAGASSAAASSSSPPSTSAPVPAQVPASSSGAPAASKASPSGSLININTADAVQLEEIPGVGEATAAKIIADREANGPFETIEDIQRVSGIGEKKFEQMRTLICV